MIKITMYHNRGVILTYYSIDILLSGVWFLLPAESQKRGGKSGGKKGLSSTHPIEKTKSHDSLQSKSTTKTTNRQALKKMTSRTGGSTSLKKAPSRLPSQRTKSGSQDSLYHEVQATNKSRDSHVTNRRQPTRTTQLPPVYTYTSRMTLKYYYHFHNITPYTLLAYNSDFDTIHPTPHPPIYYCTICIAIIGTTFAMKISFSLLQLLLLSPHIKVQKGYPT